MSEQTTEVVAETVTTEATEKTDTTDWASEAKKWEKRAKENKSAADELAALKQSQMTEAERTAARLAEMERETQAARTEARRFRTATRHGISDEDAELFLTATDEETLERQAKALAARSAQSAAPRPKADVDQGPRGSALPLNGDPLLRDVKAKLGIT